MTKRTSLAAVVSMLIVLAMSASSFAATWTVTGDPSIQTGPGSLWSGSATLEAGNTYDVSMNVLLKGTWDGISSPYTIITPTPENPKATLDKLIVKVLQGDTVIASNTFDDLTVQSKYAVDGKAFTLDTLVPITSSGVYTIQILSAATDKSETWGLIGASAPTVAPTPVPAAVWMLGSGLLGLVGYKRARKNAA